jgi:hypothetical protein
VEKEKSNFCDQFLMNHRKEGVVNALPDYKKMADSLFKKKD